MLALLRKEAREALPGFVVLSFLLSWLWIHFSGVDIVLPGNQQHLFPTTVLAVLIGVCRGFSEFAIEERNTWRYLVHRSTGYRGAFIAKIAVDFAVLALLTIIPLCLHAAWVVWFTDDASIALWSRYLEIVTTAAIAIGAHAIGVFAAQLRRPNWVRFTIAIIASLSFVFASMLISVAPYGAAIGPASRYLFWIAATSAALHTISYRLFVAGTQDDRPLIGKLGLGASVCALLLLWPSAALLVGAAQTVWRRMAAAEQPKIVLDESDRVQLAMKVKGEYFAVDVATQHATTRIPDEGNLSTVFDPSNTDLIPEFDLGRVLQPEDPQPFEFGATWRLLLGSVHQSRWLRIGSSPVQADAWYGMRERKLAILYREVDANDLLVNSSDVARWNAIDAPAGFALPSLRILGKGDEALAFSASAGVLYDVNWSRPCIVDPEDGSIWRIDLLALEHVLQRIELPNGDEFVGIEPLVPLDTARTGRPRERFVGCEFAVAGKHGIYGWDGIGFFPYTSNSRSIRVSEAGTAAVVHPEVTHPDSLEPTVVVLDAKTGATLLTHRYTIRFDMSTSAMYASSLVRPTIGGMVSMFRGASSDSMAFDLLFSDPLLAGGQRLWLLALNALLSAGLAVRVWRRGTVGDPRRAFEALAILLLGVPAAAVLALVQPRGRAARKVVVETAPREQLLISSV
jgi:hypothetical protein